MIPHNPKELSDSDIIELINHVGRRGIDRIYSSNGVFCEEFADRYFSYLDVDFLYATTSYEVRAGSGKYTYSLLYRLKNGRWISSEVGNRGSSATWAAYSFHVLLVSGLTHREFHELQITQRLLLGDIPT